MDGPNELVDEMFAKLDYMIQLEKQGIAQNEEILKAITDLTFTVRGVIEKRGETFNRGGNG